MRREVRSECREIIRGQEQRGGEEAKKGNRNKRVRGRKRR